MYEPECAGMQRLTRAGVEAVGYKLAVGARGSALEYLAASVALIVEERVPEVLHVDTYLMRTPCLEDTLHEGDVAYALQNAVVGDGVLAYRGVSEDGHLQAIVRVAGYLATYGASVVLQGAPHEGVVVALGGLVEELHAERGLGVGGLGHHEQSRGVLVDAVHEAYAGVVGVVVGIVAQMPGDGIDERAAIVAAAGVYDHTSRFVDDHEIVVFVYDVEGDVFGGDVILVTRAVHHHGDDVAGFHAVVALHGPAVHMDEACLSRLLYAVTRGVGQMVEEELVDTQQLLPPVHHDTEVLVERCLLVERCIKVSIGIVDAFGKQFIDVVRMGHASQSYLRFIHIDCPLSEPSLLYGSTNHIDLIFFASTDYDCQFGTFGNLLAIL